MNTKVNLQDLLIKGTTTDNINVDYCSLYPDMRFTPELQKIILKAIPTKELLKAFKKVRKFYYRGIDVSKPTVNFGNGEVLSTQVHITIGKFAKYNPFPGTAFHAYYLQDVVKEELNKREHIEN